MGVSRGRRLLAVAAAIAVPLVLLAATAGGERPGARGTHRDGNDARGPLDLATVRFDQQLREVVLKIRLRGRAPAMRLLEKHPRRIDGGGRHVCLVIDGREARHRVLCPGGRARRGRIDIGISRLFDNGWLDARGKLRAEFERSSKRSIDLRFPLAETRLEPGTFSWRLIAGWNGVKCGARFEEPPAGTGPEDPDGSGLPELPLLPRAGAEASARSGGSSRASVRCFDRIPDAGNFTLRVHRVVKVGCTPPADDVFTSGPRRKQIALTFDDGPSEYTERILDILDRRNAKATFFELGDAVQGHESVAREVLERGHELANHSFHHEQYAGRGSMQATNAAIEAATGFEPCLYRPPYGLMSGQTANDARREGMSTALWDVDTNDWQQPGSTAIYQRATEASRGSIVLMHDGGGPRQQTIDALPRVIDNLRSRGFRLVTVTELAGGHFRFREDR